MKKLCVLLTVLLLLTGCSTEVKSAPSSNSTVALPLPPEKKPEQTILDSYSAVKPLSAEHEYDRDFSLYKESSYDVDKDSVLETIKLYVNAEKDKSGEIMFDDGQEWVLIVQDGEKYYPVFEKTYVQLGTVDYKAFESYDENTFHILITVDQGAGIKIYDCAYDSNEDIFKRQTVFEASNINRIN